MNDVQERLRERLDHDAWSLPAGDLARRVEQGMTRRRRVRMMGAATAAVAVVLGMAVAVGLTGGDRTPAVEEPAAPLSADARYALEQLRAAPAPHPPSDAVSLGHLAWVEQLDGVLRGVVTDAHSAVPERSRLGGEHLVRLDVTSAGGRVTAVAIPASAGMDLDRFAEGLADLGEVVVLVGEGTAGVDVVGYGVDAVSGAGALLTVADDGTLAAPVQGHAAGSAWLSASDGTSLQTYDELVGWMDGPLASMSADRAYALSCLGPPSGFIPESWGAPSWFGDALPTYQTDDAVGGSDALVRGHVVAVGAPERRHQRFTVRLTVRVDDVLPGARQPVRLGAGDELEVVAGVVGSVVHERMLSGLSSLDDAVFMLSRTEDDEWLLSLDSQGVITIDTAGRLAMPARGETPGSDWFRDGGDELTTIEQLRTWLATRSATG